MDLMMRRRELLALKKEPSVINLCPAATGTEIITKFAYSSPNYQYVIEGLDPNQDYTLQATWTKLWTQDSTKRLYLIGQNTTAMIRPMGTEQVVPYTKSVTNKPNADGKLSIRANRTGLTNSTDGAEYAASMIDIMLEIGSVAHPYVPYID